MGCESPPHDVDTNVLLAVTAQLSGRDQRRVQGPFTVRPDTGTSSKESALMLSFTNNLPCMLCNVKFSSLFSRMKAAISGFCKRRLRQMEDSISATQEG